ncbi:MAG TPA: SRPBCC family protein [Myxococcaceae bacterium]|nr:SRPBCC family protein [Myxococcaceae bacterium]
MGQLAEPLADAPPHATIDPASGTVTATVDVVCPPERAWRMLVTAETERWWGSPEVYRMEEWSADLRVGGTWRVMVCMTGGPRFPASGEFLELDLPGRIVQTRRYHLDHPTLGRRDTTVTYALATRGAGTRLTVVHEGFQGLDQAASEHAFGWERMLGWLQAYNRVVRDQEGSGR